MIKNRLGFFGLIMALAMPVSSVDAIQDGTWIFNDPSGGNWNSAETSRWAGGIVANGAGSTAFFTFDPNAVRTVTLTENRTIGNVVYTDTNPTHNFNLAAGLGFGLTLDNGVNVPDINVTQATREMVFQNSLAISGSNGLRKIGAGSVALLGTNTFVGNVILNEGAIRLNNDTNLGNVNNDIVLTGNGRISTNAVTTSLNSNRSIIAGANNLSIAGTLNQSRVWQINGDISGSGTVAVDIGGTDVTFAGANTFSGNLTIAAGGQVGGTSNHTTLTIGTGATDSTSTLGNGANSVTLGGFAAVNETTAGQNGSSILRFNRNDYTFSGNISGAGIVQIDPADANFVTGAVTTLTGNNDYSGQTQIRDGALRINSATSLSANANLRFNGLGILMIGTDLDGANAADFTRSLGTGAGQVQWTGGGGFAAVGGDRVVDLGGAGAGITWATGGAPTTTSALVLSHIDADSKLTFVNGIDLGSGTDRNFRVFNGSSSIDAELSGVISGALGIIKNEAGTLQLSGTSTYSGATTVNGGTLIVSGSLQNTSSVIVNVATLEVSGAIGASGNVTVNTGGTLTGDGDIDGSLTMNAGSFLDVDPTLSNLLTVDDSMTFTDFQFANIQGWDWANAAVGTYTLINGAGSVSLLGTTPTISNPFVFGNGNIGYFQQGSFQAVIAVPEPSSLMVLTISALALLGRRRK